MPPNDPTIQDLLTGLTPAAPATGSVADILQRLLEQERQPASKSEKIRAGIADALQTFGAFTAGRPVASNSAIDRLQRRRDQEFSSQRQNLLAELGVAERGQVREQRQRERAGDIRTGERIRRAEASAAEQAALEKEKQELRRELARAGVRAPSGASPEEMNNLLADRMKALQDAEEARKSAPKRIKASEGDKDLLREGLAKIRSDAEILTERLTKGELTPEQAEQAQEKILQGIEDLFLPEDLEEFLKQRYIETIVPITDAARETEPKQPKRSVLDGLGSKLMEVFEATRLQPRPAPAPSPARTNLRAGFDLEPALDHLSRLVQEDR